MNRLLIAVSLGAAVASGCGGEDGGGVYCCTYESRHSACGGGSWTAWETLHYEFDLDDYVEGWTAEQVCAKFSGSDTACSATCCVDTEQRSNVLEAGACPVPSP